MGTSTERPEEKNTERAGGESKSLVAAPSHGLAPREAGSVALAAQVEANVKARFYLARQFPRNIHDVRSKLLEAFKRPILAEGALYSKPIGNKRVEGLSIRFAEEGARAMGNLTVDTMLVSDDDEKRVYIVTGTDLESLFSIPVTVVVTKEVERSSIKADSIVIRKRTNSQGNPTYVLRATSEDDYRSKEQALLQKARRDVILFLIPGDIKEECEAKIRETTRNRDAEDPQGATNRIADSFYNIGVSVAELEKFLGHSITKTSDAERQALRTAYTAIKEGEATWADIVATRLNTNTGADEAQTSSRGAGDRLKQAVKVSEEPKAENLTKAPEPAGNVPGHIRSLAENEHVPGALGDEDREELRQWRLDHPGVLPEAEEPKAGKVKAEKK